MTSGVITSAPLIGISCYRVQAQFGAWDLRAALLPDRYVTAVTAAGGFPSCCPRRRSSTRRSPGWTASCWPAAATSTRPGTGRRATRAAGRPATSGTAPSWPWPRRALAPGVPVLGICRGLQVLNVALGGTLHQHLPDLVGHDGHAPRAGGYGAHEVSVAPGSRLASILNRTDLTDHLPVVVPTHHHQAIDVLGAGLAATAWATDGTIEAAELDSAQHPFAVAVQWHPEAGEDLSVFRALAAAAARRSEAVPA